MLGFVPHVPDFLARLAEVNAVAFDKTGTLASSQLTLKNLRIRPDTPRANPLMDRRHPAPLSPPRRPPLLHHRPTR